MLVLSIVLLLLIVGVTVWGGIQIRRYQEESGKAMRDFDASLKPAQETLARAPAPSGKKIDYTPLQKLNIFGAIGVAPTPKASDAASKQLSTLPMTLIGTFLVDGQEPYAIIEEEKKKTQDVFMLNDSIFGEAKLVAVFPDRVDISRNGKIETLTIDTGIEKAPEAEGGVARLGENEYTVEEAELDRALENLPMLLTQARAVPYFKEGRAVGLRLFAIKTGSLFEKIGLQNGDILKSVNGSSLADLSQAMQLFQKLKEEKSIAVVMERNLVEREVKYQIK